MCVNVEHWLIKITSISCFFSFFNSLFLHFTDKAIKCYFIVQQSEYFESVKDPGNIFKTAVCSCIIFLTFERKTDL